MTDTPATPSPSKPTPAKHGSKKRLLVVIPGILVLLIVVLYFVCTSAAFFKGVILPKAGKSLGAQITVDDASISPFSQIDLKNLKIVTTGSDPLFQAEELRARYSLWSILHGTMAVDEVTLSTPVAHIAMKADGSSNLDPLLKGQPSSTSKPSAPTAASNPPNLKLKNISIKNGTISIAQDLKSGGRQTAQLNIESIVLDRLENGQSGKLTTATSFKMNRPTNDVLEAKGASSTEFTLGPDLMPTAIKAHAEQQVLNAGGSLSQLADHRVVIDGDVAPTEVKAISERFFQGQQLLGELKVSGPLDLTKKEGRLKIEASGIDNKLLNPIGAAMGIDFNKTVLDSVTEVALSQGGTVITANTRLSAANFSLTQKGQTTPTLDMQVASEVVVNTAQSSAQVQQLTLDAKQNQQPLLHGNLSKPMTVSWAKSATTAGDSTFALAVTNLNLTDWKPFLGDKIAAGRLSMDLLLNSQQSGGQLTLTLNTKLDGVSANLDPTKKGQTTPPLDLQLAGAVSVNTSQSSALVQQFTLDARQNQQPLVNGSLAKPVSITWGKDKPSVGDATLNLKVNSLNLADWKPVLGDQVSSGRLSLALDVNSQKAGTLFGVTINSQLQGLTAKIESANQALTTPALDLQLAGDVSVNTSDSSALLQQFTLDAKQNQQPLAHGSLTKPMAISWGKNAATAGDSSLTLAVTNMNLADWKPFLGGTVNAGRLSLQLDLNSQKSGGLLTLGVASRISDLSANLGTNQLTQAALAFKFNGQLADFKKVDLKDYKLDLTRQGQPALTVAGSAGYDGSLIHFQSQIHAVVFQLLGSGPEAPLDAGVKLDGSMQGKQMDLRGLHLSLSPTQRAAKNEMDATGQFDFSTTNVTKGHLAIKADTLDLTQLYDALTAKGQATKTGSAAPTKRSSSKPASAPSSSPGETEPDPIVLPLQITADATLNHVWLRDMAIENCQVTAKLDGGKLNLDPCRMTLNGAPINATADLDLGVKGYAYNVALKMDKVPVAPIADTFSPENRGKYQGFLITDTHIKGAGITGSSMQKNLGGQVALTFTNAMLQVIGPKTKLLVVPIATLLRIPEIANTPIDWLNVQSAVEAGTIRLSHAEVQSAAFQAQTHGDIPIATVLTNSPLNLPVQFSLRRTLADSANLVPANTPTNANYVLLPDFVTVTGTIGDASSKVNALGLGALMAKPAEKIAEKFGGAKAGGAVKALESLIPGQSPSGTNSSGTNKPPKFNPLDLLKKP